MILDTDTISYYLRGDENVRKKFLLSRYELASTTVNYSELIFGLKRSDNKNLLPKVELVFDNIKIYDFDKNAARVFGTLKAVLSKNGTIVADMDLMIASIAIANNEVLVSNNLKHFRKIEGLIVENWV
jgi:predicted nucleic acid-binding protein